MAHAVNTRGQRHVARWAPTALLLVAAATEADGLPDPLRPPTSMLAPATAADPAAAPGADLVLQSIVLADDRRVALVNGRPLRVGDRLGPWRLVRVGDADATLRGPDGERVLTLWTGIDKTPVAVAHAAPTASPTPKRTAERARRPDPRSAR